MRAALVFSGLNDEQHRAVEQVRGPVVVLAGAGSGKTTTITRRIANQVLTGAFVPSELLAVTFTRKAAGELRARLEQLGVPRVVAGTFHAAAQRQIGYFANERRQVVSNKLSLLGPIARALPDAYRQRALGDLASEIEWAKNRRLTPETYLDGLEMHTPPLPAELMQPAFAQYEADKERAEAIDHEDQLELAIRVFEASDEAREEFRARYRAFTVDEFQDVNLLQWNLLEQWLGTSKELCAVGDDYQAIYGFTGATPDYLLQLEERLPSATVVRLERNYRSTPEILDAANRLAPTLGGRRKRLVAVNASGQKPHVRAFDSYPDEAAAIAARCRELHARGIPLRELAVLYRVNYRSPLYEEALIAEELPFEVQGGSFLERRAASQLLRRLRARPSARAAAVEEEAVRAGWLLELPDEGIGPAELARQADLARFVTLSRGFAGDVSAYLAMVEERFGAERERDAVQLLTLHAAKGLEFEAVFLPRLEERELPYWRAITREQLDEERRLFYVGVTRAKRILELSWTREGRRSSFLETVAPLPPKHAASRQPAYSRWEKRGQTRPSKQGANGTSGSRDGGLRDGSWLPDWMRPDERND